MANAAAISTAVLRALEGRERRRAPYDYARMTGLFPAQTYAGLRDLNWSAPEIEDFPGSREGNNQARRYFNAEAQAKNALCAALAQAFQNGRTAAALAEAVGADLAGSYLRIEYAQDCSGFWLHPHTDIGVKRFTMLAYLSDDPGHADLGTDIYADKDTWVERIPFTPNSAMVFKPSDRIWHGFQPRPIKGVRKSLIVNYVGPEWRERGQLCFPDQPVL